jgi:hypothetical protein
MTSLQDCLQEVIAKGPGYFIRAGTPAAYRPSQWEPAALLAEMRRAAPGLLDDPAWMEWSTLPGGSTAGSIQPGVFGRSLGHQPIPGYGRLRVLEQSQKRAESVDETRAHAVPENSYYR